jgi:HK97 family phage major capsid protein
MSEQQQTFEAIKALRELTDRNSAVYQDNIKAINEKLDKQEAENQKLKNIIADQKNQQAEMEQKLLDKTSASNYNGASFEAKEQIKAFEKYIFKGDKSLNEQELKYLRTDSQIGGGFLIGSTMLNEIIKNIVEISNVRSIARVNTLPKKSMDMPVSANRVTAYMLGEGQTTTITDSTYGELKLVAKKMGAAFIATQEMIDDSDIDIIRDCNRDVAEEFARLEGAQFVNGDGAGNNINGFMTNSQIASINSGDTNAITFDSLIKVIGELKDGYKPTYAFNRKTLATLRTLKDGNQRYIWESGNLGVDNPATINGFPYVIFNDMPDIGAGTYPIIFGDFSNYLIGDRKDLTIFRDETTYITQQKVQFLFFRRVG